MEQTLHIKYVVKVISITKPLQKTHFTIRHPENASCLSGIAVTNTCFSVVIAPEGRPRISLDNAGFLSLATPNKGDVFYTEDLKIDKGDYRDKTEQLINPSFLLGDTEFSGKRLDYFDTAMPIQDALMEGYYEDIFIQTAVVAPPSPGLPKTEVVVKGTAAASRAPVGRSLTYKVTLYLRYIVNEKEIIPTSETCN